MGVVNCGDVENRQTCGVLCVDDGWFSKITVDSVNATHICINQGYRSTILEYGGNWGEQCRYPGDEYGAPNLGGTLNNLRGYTSWKCSSGNVYLCYHLSVFVTNICIGSIITKQRISILIRFMHLHNESTY